MRIRILLILCISAFQLVAGVSGEIYTNGYHDLVANTLNAVSGLAASNNEPLIKIAASIAVLIVAIKIIFNQNTRQIAGFEVLKMGAFILAIQALFISAPDDDNHAYAVIDRISLQTTEIRQLPKGIGEFLSLFTTLEDGIMQKMELYFTTPDSLSYRQAGLGFTVLSQIEMMRSNITSTNLKKTFHDYFSNCKVDGDMTDNTQSLNELLASEGIDLIAKLGTTKTLLTMVYSDATPNGEVKTCTEAWTSIKNELGTEAYDNQTAYAKARGMVSATYASKVAAGILVTGTNSATISAKDQLTAAIARNATVDSVKKVGTFNGVSDSLLTKQLSVSEISMTNSSILSNYQAQGTLPILKALCTAFIVVLSWIIGILAIATMNIQYVKFIVVLNIWLMLWSPLYQVLNYAIDLMVSDALSLYKDGITATNQIGVYEILGGKLAIITNLVWSIPILAFGIAKGGEFAMTQFISGMVAPVQGAAHHTTKTDLQDAMGAQTSWTGSNGVTSTYGAGTGIGGNTEKVNIDGNKVMSSSGTGSSTVTSSIDDSKAVFNNDGSGTVTNSQASNVMTNAASTQLSNTESNIKGLTETLGKESAKTVANLTTNGTSYSVNGTDTNSLGISESTAKTVQEMNSSAFKEAMGNSSKDALTDAITNDKMALTKMGLGLDSKKNLIGKAAEKVLGASGSIGVDGNISIKTSDGSSFSISKDTAFGKEFTSNYQNSMVNQMSQSKEKTQAVADVTSAVNGESQSDSNSTSRKISSAFSEQKTAAEVFANTKAQGTAQSNNLLTSAFQNYFEKNDNWKDATPEQKANFAVNKMKEWNQSEQGMKDGIQFVKDNTQTEGIKNTVNNRGDIDSGAKNLQNDTKNVVKDVSYDSNSNKEVKDNLNNKNDVIANTNVIDQNFNNKVNDKVNAGGNVEENVNTSNKNTDAAVKRGQNEDLKNVNDNVMMKAMNGLEKVADKVADVFEVVKGNDVTFDVDKVKAANENKSINNEKFNNAVNSGLIKDTAVGARINESKIGSAGTEELARIYNHDLESNTLTAGARSAIKSELGQRGYDLENREYSSGYNGVENYDYSNSKGNVGSSVNLKMQDEEKRLKTEDQKNYPSSSGVKTTF